MRRDEDGEVYQPQAGGFRPVAGRHPGLPPEPTRIAPVPPWQEQPPPSWQQPPPDPRYRGYPPADVPPPTRRPPVRRRRRPGRIVLAVLALLVLLAAAVYVYLDTGIDRVPALADYPGRPPAARGTTWLIVGSDSRTGLDAQAQERLRTGDTAGQRTDTIMIAHLPDNDTKPTLLSVPRDLVVDIPGHGRNKVNAAFSFGGPALLVQTVERLTGLRMDHYAEIGFGGFATMVDAIGGVEMDIPATIHDDETGATIPAGHQRLDGPAALAFVRTRKSEATPRSDLDRIANQRAFIGSFVHGVASPHVLLNPFHLVPLIRAIPKALTVANGDHLHHLVALAWTMRGITSDGVLTGTLPVSSSSAENLDKAKAARLFDALRNDKPITDDMIFR